MQNNFVKFIAIVVILGSLSACGKKDVTEIATPVQPAQTVIFPTPVPKATVTPLPVPVTFTPPPPTPSPTVRASATATAPPSFSMGGILTPIPTPTVPADTAESIIADYAESVLGISVNAQSVSDVNFEDVLPVNVKNELDAILARADESYFATLDEGIALVALGIDGVNGASVGAFAFQDESVMPADADTAMALLQTQFPKIADLPFQLEEESGLTVGGGKLLLPTPIGGMPSVGEGAQKDHFTFTAQLQPDGLALSVWMGVNTTVEGQLVLFALVNSM